MGSYFRDYNSPTVHQRPTVGDYKVSAVNSDHIGWVLCDGRNVKVKDFYRLWEVVGYSFGSNTSADFNLPNPAGRVPGFIGSNTGLTTRALGTAVGEETHILTIPEMPTHNHTGTTNASATGITSDTLVDTPESETVIKSVVAVNTEAVVSGSGQRVPNIIDPTHSHTFTTSNTGGSLPHNNMQPTLFMGNMFIYSGKPNYGKFPGSLNTNLF